MTLTIDPVVRAIIVDEVVPHAAETVWKVLTTSELMERWLMPNTFKPGLGAKFTIADMARGDWDGTVSCEITRWDPPHEFAFTWVGGSPNNIGDGAPLDTVVTWTLTPVDAGTRLRLVHNGFTSPLNDKTYPAMTRGWNIILPRIAALAGTVA